MRKLRDVFYINSNFSENYFIYYGMEFHEFVKSNPITLSNLLITDGKYIGNHYNKHWNLETVNGMDEINSLSVQDIYGLGNFHWLDYENDPMLNTCTDIDKSEVLYLSHYGKPLNSPFIEGINNNYVYLSHDDGWFTKLYCRQMTVFKDILENKIIQTINVKKYRQLAPMNNDTKEKLLELTKDGLLIDFNHIVADYRTLELSIYTIGEYIDMDDMYNNLEQNIHKAKYKATLIHKNKSWSIQEYN